MKHANRAAQLQRRRSRTAKSTSFSFQVFKALPNVCFIVRSGSEISFQDLNLSGPLLEAIQSAGYSTATPIQARAIPLLLAGRDVLGQAQTGTGKTRRLRCRCSRASTWSGHAASSRSDSDPELAIQVADAFRRYGTGLPGLRVATSMAARIITFSSGNWIVGLTLSSALRGG